LSNALFDRVMPVLSGNPWFFPLVIGAAALVFWKGRAKGVVFVIMLALIVSVGDGLICRTMKAAIARERPCWAVSDARCLLGKSHSGSMPSSHAANWFAAAMVAFLYYRRSILFMLPLACLVSLSRVYNGVHYPGDVLAGAVLGGGYAVAGVWGLNALWQWIGKNWFPLWWKKLPSLVQCGPTLRVRDQTEAAQASGSDISIYDSHWLRLGYIYIIVILLARLAYLASGTILLSEDEAYQWIWSKHLDLSYYSKPPLIAYTQFLGTAIWGDTEFGVRFFSPVIAAILSFILLRCFSRTVNARAAFFLLLIITAAMLMSAGSIVMTIDSLSVLFWTAAMLSGWRAVQEHAPTRYWVWTGLWMGLGFLSKYTEIFQWLCWAAFFILWKPARSHLRRLGPYLALLINILCTLPVLIWNAQRHWITVRHVAERADLNQHWTLGRGLAFFGEFVLSEVGLLNPIFFVATIWATIAFWRRARKNPLFLYFFSMGAPLILAYLLFSFHSRVQPNWIVPAVIPLFCLMTSYWEMRWKEGFRIKPWLVTGLGLGFALVLAGHNTDVTKKLTGRYLPVSWDILIRVRNWSEVARVAGDTRRELIAEGKPVFIIADHYGLVSQISFYLPEAKASVKKAPLVYYQSTDVPKNQFYYLSGYGFRKGENAIYVHELDRNKPKPIKAPARLQQEFESVEYIGIRNVMYHGQVLRPLQFFACRNLK
jgi:4-amino-4-deoxy-L-arabinose transferase-like glycosyltransferase